MVLSPLNVSSSRYVFTMEANLHSHIPDGGRLPCGAVLQQTADVSCLIGIPCPKDDYRVSRRISNSIVLNVSEGNAKYTESLVSWKLKRTIDLRLFNVPNDDKTRLHDVASSSSRLEGSVLVTHSSSSACTVSSCQKAASVAASVLLSPGIACQSALSSERMKTM